MKTVVEVEGVRRSFVTRPGLSLGRRAVVVALREVGFEIREGEVFGLLGPNGAGKTTTIKILTTMLLPTAGRAEVLGHDVVTGARFIRSRINCVFGGERSLYWRLTGLENLRYFADLYRVPSGVQRRLLPRLLELVGLEKHAGLRVEGYSRGMKQRLHIARALVNDPEVIFMDEPTIGLDPAAARTLRGLVQQLRGMGKTVLLTTHYMYEADELCDRLAVIDRGRIVALDTPANLKKLAAGKSVLEIRVRRVADGVEPALRALVGVAGVRIGEDGDSQVLQVQSESPVSVLPRALPLLEGCAVLDVRVREATLEDAYLNLVGGGS